MDRSTDKGAIIAEIGAAKKAMRDRMKQILSGLEEDDVQKQSTDSTCVLLAMPEYQNCKSISVFMSMPKGEVQTGAIVRHALSMEKTVYIPYIYKTPGPKDKPPVSIMDMLRLQGEEDYATLKPDKWGIPSIDAITVDGRTNCFGGTGLTNGEIATTNGGGLDIVLMPSVAFDSNLNRLGHGKGYYDHFLARCYQSSARENHRIAKPYLIGLALKDQMLPPGIHIPVASWDLPVDAVIYGDGLLRSRRFE